MFHTCRPVALLAILMLQVAPIGQAAATEVAVAPQPLWQTRGSSAPESVVFDAARDAYYVSNMASRGEGATPGDGFISRLDAHGNIAELKWVAGLQNPKGLALANGRLYAGDDDALVEIDPDAGAIVARHAPEDGGPALFNDATADAAGNVYVFSRRLDTVYRLSAGTFAPWAKVDVQASGRFNGLRADGDRLLAGSWQVPAADGGEQLGHLSTFALADGTPGRIGTAPIGHIDGIEPDGAGGWTVTDFTPGRLLHVDAEGRTRVLLQLVKGTADHLYLPQQQLLLIPLLLEDRLLAYRWAPDADELN